MQHQEQYICVCMQHTQATTIKFKLQMGLVHLSYALTANMSDGFHNAFIAFVLLILCCRYRSRFLDILNTFLHLAPFIFFLKFIFYLILSDRNSMFILSYRLTFHFSFAMRARA